MPGHAYTSGVAPDLEPGPVENGGLLAGAARQDGVGGEGEDASLEGILMKDRSVVAAVQEGRNAPTKRDLTLEMWKVCSLCVKQCLE